MGALCRPCYNHRRRHRYRYDPEYRKARKEQAKAAYDTDAQRERMRDYRARLRAEEHELDDTQQVQDLTGLVSWT